MGWTRLVVKAGLQPLPQFTVHLDGDDAAAASDHRRGEGSIARAEVEHERRRCRPVEAMMRSATDWLRSRCWRGRRSKGGDGTDRHADPRACRQQNHGNDGETGWRRKAPPYTAALPAWRPVQEGPDAVPTAGASREPAFVLT
jgi:hypothetical protein